MPLFDAEGPSELTRQAMEFCTAFGRDADATLQFSAALRDKDILIDRRADATLPDGRVLGLTGFRIADAEKLAALDDATIIDWHRRGILALISAHLSSLHRFQALLTRQARRDAVAVSSAATTKEA